MAPQFDAALTRYAPQVRYEHIGRENQRQLLRSRVTLIGCGGLGTTLADTLVRAGVGFLRIVDRDCVELDNLQRQVLFGEEDAAEGKPKAVAAAERLAEINSGVTVEPIVASVEPETIEGFVEGADLVLDGTDNLETRFLINDAAVKHRTPWIYAGCVGADGMVMPILPGRTPCLRCIWDRPPPPGVMLTCHTVGILAAVVHVTASLEIVEALKILTGQLEGVNRHLVQVNVWTGQFNQFDLQTAYDDGDCPCCKGGRYEYLEKTRGDYAVALLGRDAVQISPPPGISIDFERIAAGGASGAKPAGRISRYLVRFEACGRQITLFRDGRAIIKGTSDPAEGRSIYERCIGK